MAGNAGGELPLLDHANEGLRWGDRRVALSPKAFRVLCCLVERPNQMVTKDELLDTVWADTHVTEAVLTVAISQLREALGDDSRAPRFIETVHRRGYRWIGLLGGAPAAAQDEQGPHLTVPPAMRLAGRAAEMAELERALAAALGGRRQTVFVTGEPGIGKTALLDAFTAAVAVRHPQARIARGQCIDSYGAGEPYMPALEAVEALSRGEDGAEIVEILRRYAPTWLVQLGGLVEAHEAESLRRALTASSSERMTRELQRAVDIVAAERPLVLVIEDLHWSDTATVALLSALAQRREAARLLLLCSYRPVDAVAHHHPVAALGRELSSRRLAAQLPLAGLTEAGVAELLQARFVEPRVPARLCAALSAQTAGNPLFLANTIDELIERGWLRVAEGVWHCDVDVERLVEAVPEGSRELIETRIARLPAATQELLEAASLAGGVFTSRVLAAALGRDVDEIESTCAELERSSQILESRRPSRWPDGRVGAEVAFSKALYAQVLQSRVAPARAALLHGRIAAALEESLGAAAAESAPQLALHFEQAGDLEKAVLYRRQAAKLAEARFAYHEAGEHLRRGLALLERLPAGATRDQRELEMLAALVTPIYATNEAVGGEIGAMAERIAVLAGEGETSVQSLQALGSLMTWHAARGELAQAQAVCERALERAVAAPWGMLIAGIVKVALGLYLRARGQLRRAVEVLAEAPQMPSVGALVPVEANVAGCAELGMAWCLLGQPAQGLALAREGLRRAQETGRPSDAGYACAELMRIGIVLRDASLVGEMATALEDLTERLQMARWRGLPEIATGWLRMQRDEANAIEDIRAGIGRVLDTGIRLHQSLYAAIEAEALIRQQRLDEARTRLATALEAVDDGDERWCEVELHRLQGEVADSAEAAESSRRRALEIAIAQGARWWELRARISVARHAGGKGGSAARRALRTLVESFDEGHDLADLVEARQVLRLAHDRRG